MRSPPIIYNLFPRLVGHMGRWPAHAGRAREMGFNWIFLNPIQYAGFSGSLYAVKDYYSLNPMFIPPGVGDPIAELRRILDAIHHEGLQVMTDLVINHTAKDSELTKEHPDWYRRDEAGEVLSPSAIDPADSRKVTVWGDLAEIDNDSSPDRKGLWAYWTRVVEHYLDLGFDGFRCDAAYKVPAKLWQQLTSAARRKRPAALFAAETLGCRLPEVRQLKGSGVDYLFNSSKYWNFDAPWCLEQHEEFQRIAPSIAFPESHDTVRLMEETGGLLQVQKQRYAFAAVFSAGLLMPIGYELGFRKRINVVNTQPSDWEETGVDLSPFIKEVNRLKSTIPVLGVEGHWSVLTELECPTTVLLKKGDRLAPALILINKDWHRSQSLELPSLDKLKSRTPRLLRPFQGGTERELPPDLRLTLEPAEVAVVVG